MFTRGLSLDQAPPFEAVARFFLTIPLFGLIASFALFSIDPALLTVWDAPATAAIVHLVLLGMVANAMIGSLFQMLPVIASASLEKPLAMARWVHGAMAAGIFLLVSALWTQQMSLLHPALALLLAALGYTSLRMLARLLRVENKTPSVRGMIFALGAFVLGLLFAILASLGLMGVDVGFLPGALRTTHLHFMLFGWIFILIMGVAFQVIEMFYVTPPYPQAVQHHFPRMLLILLTLDVPFELFYPAWSVAADAAVALIIAIFSGITLKRLRQRKRPVADTTAQLWRTGLLTFSLAALIWFVHLFTASDTLFALSAYLFGYAVLSIVFAMSYKIIPFLVWFHLNAKGVLETPMMGDIVPAKMMRPHLWLHWAFGALLAGGLFVTPLVQAAALLFLLESLLYGWNLFKAARIYHTLKTKGMFA